MDDATKIEVLCNALKIATDALTFYAKQTYFPSIVTSPAVNWTAGVALVQIDEMLDQILYGYSKII